MPKSAVETRGANWGGPASEGVELIVEGQVRGRRIARGDGLPGCAWDCRDPADVMFDARLALFCTSSCQLAARTRQPDPFINVITGSPDLTLDTLDS